MAQWARGFCAPIRTGNHFATGWRAEPKGKLPFAIVPSYCQNCLLPCRKAAAQSDMEPGMDCRTGLRYTLPHRTRGSCQMALSHRERIIRTLSQERPDRVALLGGWVLGDQLQADLAGMTPEEYWRDPLRAAFEAERSLGVDAIIALHPASFPGEYRGDASKETFEAYKERFNSPEDVRDYVLGLPSPEEALASFDASAWLAAFRSHINSTQAMLGDIVYLPTLWDIVHPTFEHYPTFGYMNYLMFLKLYPEAAEKLFWSQNLVERRKAELVVKLYRELDIPPLTLIGTDIAGRDGPMVSPAFLDRYYFPAVRHAIQPMVEAGFHLVWHSDGMIHPLVDSVLSTGAAGFQGFQTEYGVDLAWIAGHRRRDGQRLTIWAGLSTAALLRYGTPDEIRQETERIIDTLADTSNLFILPGNNVLPDCPPENVRTMYRHAAEYSRRR